MPRQPEREVRVPPISYPGDLPVVERREEIAAAISRHQVVVLAGETGSGKTTQLPKICLELGRGRQAMIGHTQPRRLAARTVAQRIALELGEEAGGLVGYQVRFQDKVGENTAIKLMTDGILLAEIQRDRLLRRYDTLIIDEAHERSLNIDFLLGYLKQLLPKRPDLKLIITSATIDVESFSRHFSGAPVLEVSGRSYPVETLYLEDLGTELAGQELDEQIARLVDDIEAARFGRPGDALVFLPGERDIRDVARRLRQAADGRSRREVLPLYARLGQAEQSRVFAPRQGPGIRVVLATNVAETSLTVPGIRYVIDPGVARISRYSYRTKVQRLPVEAVSQASADQRRGRCGRIAAGVCLRLYTQEDFAARPAFTEPEIQRTNLAAVILQMLLLRLGRVEDFPFINPPDRRLVRDGYRLLQELGAVDARERITGRGRRMAAFPVDPRIARMILAAAKTGCLEPVLVIAAALSIQDPRERPADKQQQSDQAHARFRDARSDFLAWLNLWRYYEAQRQSLSQGRLRQLCKREFLAFMRMREWREVHYQLVLACRQQGLAPRAEVPDEDDYESIHRALLSGLLGNIAQWQEGREYLGARNRRLHIFPGSHLAKKPPKWLVAAEIVETGKVYARVNAMIDPAWALDINPELLKRHHYAPRWQPRSGRVMAMERVSLYGLTLLDKRSVHYGPINPGESRELLIREGLVAGRYARPPAFLRANQKQISKLEDLESRLRRRDILVDEDALFRFYDERLTEQAYTDSHLKAWLKKTEGADASLRMSREHLTLRMPEQDLGEQFPDRLDWRDLSFKLSYRFEPGKVVDGVNITIPVALLNRVPRYRLEWLVPGLLSEKCIQLVKGLPKALRKQLVPVPDRVAQALEGVEPDDISLVEVLAQRLGAISGARLQASDFEPDRLEDFYRMNVRIVDADGKLLEQGRDLSSLLARYRDEQRELIGAGEAQGLAQQGLRQWALDELPRQWRFRQAGQDIVAYPAAIDRGDTVDIGLCDYPLDARREHRRGVLKLLRLQCSQEVKYLRKQLLRGNDHALALAGAGLERIPLVDDLIDAAIVSVADLDGELPYDRHAYDARLFKLRSGLVAGGTELGQVAGAFVAAMAAARRRLAAFKPDQYVASRADIEAQLERFSQPGLLGDTPAEWLSQFPRYMKALEYRLERLSGQLNKDEQTTELLAQLAAPLAETADKRPGLLLDCPAAMSYRWRQEELRVSLFAQQLGTRVPVSRKRLDALWQEVLDWLRDHPA
ncbi:MAG: ATP-dependent RNA helicase HrpA [Pseudomonadota bacterium]